MGLDIRGTNDSFHLNWAGTETFADWCAENGLPNPFPNWGGTNDGDTVDCTDHNDRAAVADWIVAYQAKFPDEAALGIGRAMRELMYVSCDHGRRAAGGVYRYDPAYADWEKWTGLAWYHFLRGQLDREGTIEYR